MKMVMTGVWLVFRAASDKNKVFGEARCSFSMENHRESAVKINSSNQPWRWAIHGIPPRR